ncbi:MAG TPA: Dyp-type peroxidase [Solirubrobacteraceae bacterium]|nr:Dyp-type peroxidase [Solirubrobacteraceae bacterium]
MTAGARVRLGDLQGNVLCGYGHGRARYVFLRFGGTDGGAGARRVVARLAPRVQTAKPWAGDRPDRILNAAFTWAGLRALGVPPVTLASFPQEFREGMAPRAAGLGDVGESDREHWRVGREAGALHAVVTLYGADDDALADAAGELDGVLAEPGGGIEVVDRIDAGLLEGSREHFGFLDGFSQPAIRDAVAGPTVGHGTPLRLGGWRDVEPGEFVLGYDDEDGGLPEAPRAPFHRDGSFMVVRVLRQHVDRFTRFLRERAAGDPAHEEWLAARIVGRHRDGRPLLGPGRRRPGPRPLEGHAGEVAERNAFRYAGDKSGLGCPRGAHIRRTNPRDALGWEGRLTKRHRIVRRGVPYGPPPADPLEDDGIERGLVFVCFQASIARQFEVVQRGWVDDGDAFGLGDDRDFLIGRGSPDGKMTIPRRGGAPVVLTPQPDFVTTRGGDYFFVPSVPALRHLGEQRAQASARNRRDT